MEKSLVSFQSRVQSQAVNWKLISQPFLLPFKKKNKSLNYFIINLIAFNLKSYINFSSLVDCNYAVNLSINAISLYSKPVLLTITLL